MSEDTSHVLSSLESEALIDGLQRFGVIAVGSPRWQQQHEYLERLNMQAILSASSNQEEFIKEQLISSDKVSLIIHELIAVETWKEKVFPQFIHLELEPSVMFPLYMVLYHEATVANLLETTLFHRDACEAADDAILDVVDYCYHKILSLITLAEEPLPDAVDTDSCLTGRGAETLEELQKLNCSLNFDLSMKAISLLCYLSDHMGHVMLSVSSRLLNVHDVPLLLVQLIELEPWSRRSKGQLQKHTDNKWMTIPESDRFKLTKIEAQVWLSLYNLLMSETGRRKYEFSSHRKNTLLRLRKYLTEILLDQLPALGDFLRYLEQLSMMEAPSGVKTDLLIEQIPEIREKMISANAGRWAEIARKQSETFFNPEKVDLRQQARRLADTYNMDALESLIAEPPKCASCGEPACKRCSKCKNEWYCRRECQVSHWKKHKLVCDMLTSARAKNEDASNTAEKKVTT